MSVFQTKDFASIAAAIINYARASQGRITDFSPGSVARTLLEAPAVELDELYQQFFLGLREAIPTSVYNAFGFERLPAQAASGMVRVELSASASAVVIPQGTVFRAADAAISYVSLQDATVAAGQTQVSVRVVAVTPGAGGNVPGATRFALTPVPGGFVSAVAEAAFEAGSEAETDEQRKERFLAYIGTLPRGTVSAVRYGAKLAYILDASGAVVERVADAAVVEPYLLDSANPRAWVQVYIDNGLNGASAALVARAQELVDGYIELDGTEVPGYKAAGVKVDVLAATQQAVNVAATVSVQRAFDRTVVIDAVKAAITSYLRATRIGSPAFRSEIIAAAMGVDGVENFVMTEPAADAVGAVGAVGAKVVPGSLTIV